LNKQIFKRIFRSIAAKPTAYPDGLKKIYEWASALTMESKGWEEDFFITSSIERLIFKLENIKQGLIGVVGLQGVGKTTALIFLYIVDPTFIKPPYKTLTDIVLDELEQLGRGLLGLAQSRAREQSLQADIAIRRGAIQPTMENFLREVNASTVVIGAPQRSSTAPVFNSEAITPQRNATSKECR
jgi:hypothetical protein